MAFCAWLTQRKREAGRLPEHLEYRLPGEAEWEHACRGGSEQTRFWWGNEVSEGKGRFNVAGTDPLPSGAGWQLAEIGRWGEL